ncbi:MAG: hypothetical protein WBC05_24960 [Sedimentisphaerales bacterium]
MLKLLVGQAEGKENHIDKLRQVNFSITLFVFTGLVGFGASQGSIAVRFCVTFVLVAFMIILSDYDHSLHKYLHGWRRTKEEHLVSLSSVINTPVSEVTIQTFYKVGEERAVKENCHSIRDLFAFITKHERADKRIPSRMRVVYYLLVRGAMTSVIPFLLIKGTS